jgi:hypothetical protein
MLINQRYYRLNSHNLLTISNVVQSIARDYESGKSSKFYLIKNRGKGSKYMIKDKVLYNLSKLWAANPNEDTSKIILWYTGVIIRTPTPLLILPSNTHVREREANIYLTHLKDIHIYNNLSDYRKRLLSECVL